MTTKEESSIKKTKVNPKAYDLTNEEVESAVSSSSDESDQKMDVSGSSKNL